MKVLEQYILKNKSNYFLFYKLYLVKNKYLPDKIISKTWFTNQFSRNQVYVQYCFVL
jgi:hypothetical protein